MRVMFAGSPAPAVPVLDALLASRHEVALAITREELSTLRLVSLGLMPSLVLVFGGIIWRTRRGR